jgi:hypothetical protein
MYAYRSDVDAVRALVPAFALSRHKQHLIVFFLLYSRWCELKLLWELLPKVCVLIDVDLKFKTMEDFEPAQVVKRIPELAALLEARAQLTELVMYMDGKAAAEDVIEELLKNPRWSDAIKGSADEESKGDPA